MTLAKVETTVSLYVHNLLSVIMIGMVLTLCVCLIRVRLFASPSVRIRDKQ